MRTTLMLTRRTLLGGPLALLPWFDAAAQQQRSTLPDWDVGGIPAPEILAADAVVIGGKAGGTFTQHGGGSTLPTGASWPTMNARRNIRLDGGGKDLLILPPTNGVGQPIPLEDVQLRLENFRHCRVVGVQINSTSKYFGARRVDREATLNQAISGGGFRAWPASWNRARDNWIRSNLARNQVRPDDCAHWSNWSTSWKAASGGVEQCRRRNPWIIFDKDHHPDENIRNDSNGNVDNGHYSFGQGQGCDRYLWNERWVNVGGQGALSLRFEGFFLNAVVPDINGECDGFSVNELGQGNDQGAKLEFVFCNWTVGYTNQDDRDVTDGSLKICRTFHSDGVQRQGAWVREWGFYNCDLFGKYCCLFLPLNESPWTTQTPHFIFRRNSLRCLEQARFIEIHGHERARVMVDDLRCRSAAGGAGFGNSRFFNVGGADGQGWRTISAEQDASVTNARWNQDDRAIPERAPGAKVGVNYVSPWSR